MVAGSRAPASELGQTAQMNLACTAIRVGSSGARRRDNEADSMRSDRLPRRLDMTSAPLPHNLDWMLILDHDSEWV